MSGSLIFLGLSLLGFGATGCAGNTKVTEETEKEKQEKECGRCHQNPYEPQSGFKPLFGREDERSKKLARFMDRHTKVSERLTHPLLCKDCHKLPEYVTAPGHINGDPTKGAEVFFAEGSRARARGVDAYYDPETKTCTVACHGAGLKLGGVEQSPPWDEVPETPPECGPVCHTLPPKEPHWQNLETTDCGNCHKDTVAADGKIKNKDFHINGIIDKPDPTSREEICTACHDQPPGRSPLGTEAERKNHIGAHQTHLVEQPLSTNVECNNCHEVSDPDNDLPGHRDGDGRAEVTFSGLAITEEATPSFNPETLVCSGTYCHGATLGGKEPQWNNTDGAAKECDSCHGAPPPLPHMQPAHKLAHREAQEKLECSLCHDETAGPGQTIANKKTHVNGKIDVKADICEECHGQPPAPPENENHPEREDCWSCHPSVSEPEIEGSRPEIIDPALHNNGEIDLIDDPEIICVQCHGTAGAGNAAPPKDTSGNIERSARAVGAHQQHLTSQKTDNIECGSCHNVPENVFAEGHRNRTADIHFSGTAVFGAEGEAEEEGFEPFYDRETQTCTVYCHGVTRQGGKLTHPVWVDLSGEPAECDSCHGAPPPLPHMQPPHKLAHQEAQEKLQCSLCHDETAGEEEGTINNRETHLNGDIDVKEDICEECHGQPPAPPENEKHPGGPDTFNRPDVNIEECWTCHTTVEQPENEGDRPVIIYREEEGAPNHNDGKIDLKASPEICTKCHGSEETGPAPGADRKGNIGNEALRILHAKHLRNTEDAAYNGKITTNVACGICHHVPEDVMDEKHLDGDGVPEVTFSGIAVFKSEANDEGEGFVPFYNAETQTCTVYCHGVTLTGNRPDPSWEEINENPAECNVCHDFPPQSHRTDQDGDGRPDWLIYADTWEKACQFCHPDVLEEEGRVFIDPDLANLHIDGIKQDQTYFLEEGEAE